MILLLASVLLAAQSPTEALRALESASAAGITQREYQTRFADTKVIVDKFLRQSPTGAKREAAQRSMQYFGIANFLWLNKLAPGSTSPQMQVAIGKLIESRVGDCTAIKELVAAYNASGWDKWEHSPSETAEDSRAWRLGRFAELHLASFFACAAKQIDVAESANN